LKIDNHIELFRKLYSFQKEALLTIEKYLKSKSNKNALIKLPTGTGKTIIIAYISNYYKKHKNILIVSPSKGITDQLTQELKDKIISKFELKAPFKNVEKLYPSNINDLLKTKKNTIYICTAKTINDIREKHFEDFEKLKEKISLVIFDEGHREPAKKWQQTIRALNKKVILFTATPLRNDNNNFYLDKKFVYNYSFQRAIEENRIRSPRFIKYQGVNSLEEFLNKVVHLTKQMEEKNNKKIKTIIRFKDVSEILKAKDYLNKKGETVTAIHDTFKTDVVAGHFKNVPNTEDIPSTFWLHQNKLIEGIDDNDFSILAIYDSFNDVRSLIQQVGRIIRKNDLISESIVIYREGSVDQEKLFKEYLYYEYKLNEDINLISFNYDDYFNKITSDLPDVMHINNRFLEKVNYLKSELDEDLIDNFRLPLQTNVFYIEEPLEGIDNYYTYILNNLINGYNAKVIYEFKNSYIFTIVVVYSIFRNSPYLVNNYFIEPKLGISVMKINEEFLFYYDSNNIIPNEIYEKYKRVPADRLQKLFDNNTTFKEVTINNGFISDNIKREKLSSENMEAVSPTITDKYKFLTTVYGVSNGHDNKARGRYIGFSNARVSDSSNLFYLKEYISWINYLSKKLKLATIKPSIFKRYGSKANTPDVIEPINILIDIEESKREEIYDVKHNSLFLEKLIFDVENWKFNIDVDEKSYEIEVEFDDSKQNYQLKKIGKWNLYINIDDKKEDLITYLNKLQNFQILTKDCKSVYCKGDFYEIGIKDDDNRLLDILVEFKTKKVIKKLNEKGKFYREKKDRLRIPKPIWDDNSLFYLVSNYARNLDLTNKGSKEISNILKNLDYLICTDLQSEIADFIGLNENSKSIYFIHCKASNKKLSASAFQDVCGQIIKNLDYVNPLSNRKPKNLKDWDKDWVHDSYCVRTNRIIVNTGRKHPEKIWEKIKRISRDQDSNVYVWALLGDMFSMQEYQKEKQSGRNPTPEIIQIEYLLMSTWAAVQNSNAKFKIYFNQIS
jgi:superfamily II DNA or RNA helicase